MNPQELRYLWFKCGGRDVHSTELTGTLGGRWKPKCKHLPRFLLNLDAKDHWVMLWEVPIASFRKNHPILQKIWRQILQVKEKKYTSIQQLTPWLLTEY